MDVERRLLTLDVLTSLLLALLTDLTTQAAIEHNVDASLCPQQCHHHGDCLAGSEGVLSCRCHTGWGGNACSVECVKPCQNGQCLFIGGKQACVCSPGFHGDECQHPGYSVMSLFHIAKLLTQKWDKTMPLVQDPVIDIEQNIRQGSASCTNNFQCRNGGKCRRGGFGGYRCECDVSRHTGTFCQFRCPQTCQNGGKCVRLRKSGISVNTSDSITLQESEARYSCVCIEGFSGVRCQRRDIISKNSDNHRR